MATVFKVVDWDFENDRYFAVKSSNGFEYATIEKIESLRCAKAPGSSLSVNEDQIVDGWLAVELG